MRIGIEFRQITPGSSGGIYQNLIGVLLHIFRLYPDQEFYVYCAFFNRKAFPENVPNVHLVTMSLVNYPERLDEQLVADKVDVLFRAYPTDYPLNYPAGRQICFIPDLQHEAFPEFFSPEALRVRRLSFEAALSTSGAIGTISHHAMKTMQDSPSALCQDFFLMSPALDVEGQSPHAGEPLSDEEKSLLAKRPFFYFPANLWPHKNHRRTLQAFAMFLEKTGADVELILTGHPQGWDYLRKEFPSLPVRHLGYVSPRLVQHLYANAQALVFFSLYEGFGMPLLEAFSAGTPVICSSAGSLPEIGGDAVLACDPTDVEAMCALMARVNSDKALRAELAQRGKARLDHYSWEKSAHNLMAACQRVAGRAAQAAVPALKRQADWNPLVTIVTPSYNQGRFLRRTIESVLNQTYANIEYLVMDGGSKDESLEILTSYGDRFTWVSEPDKGQTNAINKGFARATGEIYAYLNSDDVLELDAVEKVVQAFREHPEWDMVYGKANYIDENDCVIGQYNTDDYTFERFMHDNCICQPAAFWRASIARMAGPFDETVLYAMDHDYWLRIDRVGGRIHHIHELLASSRVYQETKTKSARDKIYAEIFRVSKKHAGYVSLNYYLGLWHYRVWETNTLRAKIMRRIPKSFVVAANLHLLYDRRHEILRGMRKQRISDIKYRLARRAPWLISLQRARRNRLTRVGEQKPVYGFFSDNWFGPTVKIYIKQRVVGEQQYVSGIPAVNNTLKVKVDRKTVANHRLTAGQPCWIEVNARPGQTIELLFGKHNRFDDGRDVSFLVQGTNLFGEQEAFL